MTSLKPFTQDQLLIYVVDFTTERQRNGILAVRSLSIKDAPGVANVCLFEQNADMEFKRNQVVNVTSVYSKTFQAMEQLTATLQTKCHILNDENTLKLDCTLF